MRSVFAHSAAPIDFQTDDVRKEILKLAAVRYVGGPEMTEERRLFLGGCGAMIETLLSILGEIANDWRIEAEVNKFYNSYLRKILRDHRKP
jgi:hypothetical protein